VRRKKLLQDEQKDLWDEYWSSCPYSIKDMINGDKWVAVKYSPLLPYIMEYVPRGKKVLEAGCGMGPWVIYLNDLGYKIIGLDFSIQTIKQSKRLYPSLKFIAGDVVNLGLKDNSFDAVLSWGVVEHFEAGPHRALGEMFRVLRSGGLLFITVPCKNMLYFSPLLWVANKLKRNKVIRNIMRKGELKNSFINYEFTKRKFCLHLQSAGYELIKVLPISHEVGFAKPINLHLLKGAKLFHKNKFGNWEGLSKIGSFLCRCLKRISPWITPDQIFSIAIKK